jgi:hypothetical protein
MIQMMHKVRTGFCLGFVAAALIAQPMPQTKKQDIRGTSQMATEQLNGTVVYVEGNTLVVKMASGDIRKFDPPPERRFIVDGKSLTVSELKPGTALKATVTTTTTPITERTTTIGTGKVWFVSGNSVIITLPNNENRMYKVTDSYRFNIEGKQASVFELRKGMVISAEKIVESPRVEIASNTQVVGSAPSATPVAATTPTKLSPSPAPEAPAPTRAAAPAPAPTPAAAPAPAPAPQAQVATALPEKLPNSGSAMPLIGLLGVLCSGAAYGLLKLRRG